MVLLAHEALEAWEWAAAPQAERLSSGLINESHRVIVNGRPVAALQRLNTQIFDPHVLEDIHALTQHLARRGLPTPLLLPTRAGALGLRRGTDEVWRCYTWVGAQTLDTIELPAMVDSAATLVARFHSALADFDWRFRNQRPDPHDTPKHMDHLKRAVEEHQDHRLYDQVAPLADRILLGWSALPSMPSLPQRVVHGDLKISNVRFDGTQAVAIIDLDTVAPGRFDAELGDALRSWCNAAGEDRAQADLRLDIFEAAMRGYAAGCATDHPPSSEEWGSIIPGWQRITVELAARFAADALHESYFGWDPRFGTRGEHCLLRAQG